MKALTILQPWARLVAGGDLRFVTRASAVDYRGGVAIHAADRMTPAGGRLAGEMVFAGELDDHFPLGAIVGVGVLVEVHETRYLLDFGDLPARERRWLESIPGTYAWEIAETKPLAREIAHRGGGPNLWDWTPPPTFEDPQ